MKKTVEMVNELAGILKVEGFGTQIGRQAWGEISTLLYPVAEKQASKYVNTIGVHHRIEEATLISLALYEGIKRALKDWDVNKGDFEPRFKCLLKFLFMTHKRNEVDTDKRKMLTTAGSIHTPLDGADGVTLEDTIIDDGASVEELCLPSRVETIFAEYEKVHGKERADLARLIIAYDDRLEMRNKAICAYYNVYDYNATLRKRVQRAKEHFQKFCIENKDFLLA